jgi:hypothetical protein
MSNLYVIQCFLSSPTKHIHRSIHILHLSPLRQSISPATISLPVTHGGHLSLSTSCSYSPVFPFSISQPKISWQWKEDEQNLSFLTLCFDSLNIPINFSNWSLYTESHNAIYNNIATISQLYSWGRRWIAAIDCPLLSIVCTPNAKSCLYIHLSLLHVLPPFQIGLILMYLFWCMFTQFQLVAVTIIDQNW